MTDASYFHYWGKARKEGEAGEPYHRLTYHSLDVAAVGHVLLDRHPLLFERLAAMMHLAKPEAREWCIFLLGIHDLGKFARSFQMLREDLRAEFWPDEQGVRQDYSVRHDSLGRIIWRDRRLGIRRKLFTDEPESVDDFVQDVLDFWLDPVFGHHGWPPGTPEEARRHFTTCDAEAALDFVRTWSAIIGLDISAVAAHMQEPGWAEQQKKASWLLAGIAVLCDWLGSDETVFEYCSDIMPLEAYWNDCALPLAEKVIEKAGIIPPPAHKPMPLGVLFPYIEQATPLQRTCAEIELVDEPQLFILEDVTGAGKTEAALMLAHRLIAADQGRGVYIGLPTMATANAMYERMAQVYRMLYADAASPSLILSHSARHLSDLFQQTLLDAEPKEQSRPGQQIITAQCNRWLADSRKKALLADVGIGTLDQALLGVVAVRHQSLRLLGLLNKVLILDEVHAYDAYTNRLMHNLIRFHAAFGGSVILLSATLTRQQRQALVDAFQAGRGDSEPSTVQSADYPLLTRTRSANRPEECKLQTRDSVRRSVAVKFLNHKAEIAQTIQDAVEAGQCVCWIRNTVGDVRETWGQLRETDWLARDHLHLFHSRYALGDRLEIEQRMLALFGKDRNAQDRHGQVLIATQVVEQSLDLDFDLMISDLAPVDLLIQRAGRLHRHSRDKQGHLLQEGEADERGKPLLIVHAPPFTEEPAANWYKDKFLHASHVYSHTLILWRTAQILQNRGGWRMPEDARELLEYVYDPEGEIPVGLSDNDLKAEGERYSDQDMARDAALILEAGYSDSAKWNEEAHLKTRLGEDTRPLYLARWNGNVLTPWRDEGRYCWDLSSVSVSPRQLARVAEQEQPELKEALQGLREKEKLFDEYSLILPLQQQNKSWNGEALDENDRIVFVTYITESGLELERGN